MFQHPDLVGALEEAERACGVGPLIRWSSGFGVGGQYLSLQDLVNALLGDIGLWVGVS